MPIYTWKGKNTYGEKTKGEIETPTHTYGRITYMLDKSGAKVHISLYNYLNKDKFEAGEKDTFVATDIPTGGWYDLPKNEDTGLYPVVDLAYSLSRLKEEILKVRTDWTNDDIEILL